MSQIGDNNPPEETIAELVLLARQARDTMDKLEDQAEKAEAPFLKLGQEASAEYWADHAHHDMLYRATVARIAKWQERQRVANPFADPKEVSRVIIDGEVAATTRKIDSFEVFKPELVPRELCKPDEAKIKAALSKGEDVPGVAPKTKFSTIVR